MKRSKRGGRKRGRDDRCYGINGCGREWKGKEGNRAVTMKRGDGDGGAGGETGMWPPRSMCRFIEANKGVAASPEVWWLLAVKLMRPHRTRRSQAFTLSWRAGQSVNQSVRESVG